MNLTKHNLHQVNELPQFFKSLGGNPDNANVSKTAFTLPKEASKEEADDFFENNVSKEMKKHLRFEYDKEKNIISKEDKCNWLVPTVRWNGEVSICCHDQLGNLNLGNAFKKPLEIILNSKKYKIFEKKGRKRKLSFCKNCN